MTETPLTKENIERFLEGLDDPKKRLTSWEEEFISSITDQFNRKGTLSPKQFAILEKIYVEKAP